jgi:hypothetical protein
MSLLSLVLDLAKELNVIKELFPDGTYLLIAINATERLLHSQVSKEEQQVFHSK